MIAPQKKPETRYYVRRGNHVEGPVPASRIRAWRREGTLPANVLLSKDGQTWHPVRWKRGTRPR